MHALQNAIYGELDTDPFYGGEDLLAETGFEAEYTLLNGQFDILYSQRSPRGHSGVRAALRPDEEPARRHPAHLAVAVPEHHGLVPGQRPWHLCT